MTDQTTETRVAEIEKRAVDALGIGAFGKAALVCRSDIPWLATQLRAAWKREAALREALTKAADYISQASDRFDGHDTEGFHAAEVAERNARTVLQETPDER